MKLYKRFAACVFAAVVSISMLTACGGGSSVNGTVYRPGTNSNGATSSSTYETPSAEKGTLTASAKVNWFNSYTYKYSQYISGGKFYLDVTQPSAGKNYVFAQSGNWCYNYITSSKVAFLWNKNNANQCYVLFPSKKIAVSCKQSDITNLSSYNKIYNASIEYENYVLDLVGETNPGTVTRATYRYGSTYSGYTLQSESYTRTVTANRSKRVGSVVCSYRNGGELYAIRFSNVKTTINKFTNYPSGNLFNPSSNGYKIYDVMDNGIYYNLNYVCSLSDVQSILS